MTSTTPTAIDLAADLIASLWTAPPQRVAKMLDSGPSKYITVLDTDDNDITLTYSHMRSHVIGSATYACPLAGADGRARALAVEIDQGGEAAVVTALEAAATCNLTAFAIACRGSGDHDGGHA